MSENHENIIAYTVCSKGVGRGAFEPGSKTETSLKFRPERGLESCIG